MQTEKEIIKDVVRKSILPTDKDSGIDYRYDILIGYQTFFLKWLDDFLSKIDTHKKEKDWYQKYVLRDEGNEKYLHIYSGINKKTITNIFGGASKNVIRKLAQDHYGNIKNRLKKDFDKKPYSFLSETIKKEDFLFIFLVAATKYSEIRGGAWSSLGKKVEGPLMKTLCQMFEMPEQNYRYEQAQTQNKDILFEREIDFYLIKENNEEIKCEVKLMGRGNPESADAVIARDSHLFIADTLSDTNKKQLDALNVCWVQLRDKNVLGQFEKALEKLDIPHSKSILEKSEVETKKILDAILKKL